MDTVLRFYTNNPTKIRRIIQLLSNEVSLIRGEENKIIPKYKDAIEYDTSYGGVPVWKSLTEKYKTKTSIKKYYDEIFKKTYPKILFNSSNGTVDEPVVIKIDKYSVIITIGIDDISFNETKWIKKIERMGILLEEISYTNGLEFYSRTPMTNIKFFEGSKIECPEICD